MQPRTTAHRPCRTRIVSTLALFTALVPSPGGADVGFSAHGLRTRPNRLQGYLASSSARVIGSRGWSVGVVSGHAVRPLVVAPETLAGSPYVPNGRLITSQTVTEIVAAVGLLDFLEFGVVAPIVLGQEGDTVAGLTDPKALDSGAAFSDVWLDAKATVFGLGSPDDPNLTLAVEAGVGLPTGDRSAFQGSGPQIEPRLILEGRIPGGPALVGNVGYSWREAVRIPGLEVGHGILWAAGVEVPVLPWVAATAEAFHTTSTEALLACHVDLGRARLELGGGVGLTDEAGTPDWRAFAGLSFGSAGPAPAGLYLGGGEDEPPPRPAPAPPACEPPPASRPADSAVATAPPGDADHDGLVGSDDACPGTAEDPDGFQDADGCPEPDNDEDGIPDVEDHCPLDSSQGFSDGRPGCPESGRRDQIETVVYFAPYTARLSTMATYSLRLVARALRESPEIEHLWAVGHADAVNDPKLELQLSSDRASVVRQALLDAGIEARRVSAIGVGAAARMAGPGDDLVLNRRVEFQVSGRDTPPSFGAPAPTAP